MGGFPSGQRGQTVNLLAMLSKVRILLRPFVLVREFFLRRDFVSNLLTDMSALMIIAG